MGCETCGEREDEAASVREGAGTVRKVSDRPDLWGVVVRPRGATAPPPWKGREDAPPRVRWLWMDWLGEPWPRRWRLVRWLLRLPPLVGKPAGCGCHAGLKRRWEQARTRRGTPPTP